LPESEARKYARRTFNRPFDRPAYWDYDEYNSPAKPVVGLNWHEAEAYCRWLSAVTKHAFRLPAEMEWEKAARGPSATSGHGREYPWGDDYAPNLGNTSESHLYTTTPVGMFPEGVSAYGVFDLAGNVWEWTADWYQVYGGGKPEASADFGKRFRVFRGGSWYSRHKDMRCARRDKFLPISYDTDLGFRLLAPAEGE
jgi:formylglycine-generating enzyme required for sulfatase activity